MAVVTGRIVSRGQASQVNLGGAWGTGDVSWEVNGGISGESLFTWYDEDRVVAFITALEEAVGRVGARR